MLMYGSPSKTYPIYSTPNQYWIRVLISFHSFDLINKVGYILIKASFLEFVG